MPPRPHSSLLRRRASQPFHPVRNGLTCSCRTQHESAPGDPSTDRSFSSSTAHLVTRQRRKMFEWLDGPGKVFRDPLPGSTNYLNAYTPDGKLVRARGRSDKGKGKDKNKDKDVQPGSGRNADQEGADSQALAEGEEGPKPEDEDVNLASKGRDGKGKALPKERYEDLRPFPDNTHFRSEEVLSEELKSRIYKDVTRGDVTVREASEKHQVDIRRVGAVVRLKAIEEAWVKEGRQLARPYARAIMGMLPQTRPGKPHESLNDLPVHRSTMNQLFWPVAESRQFTRADAGEAFQRGLLPADQRIPHPQMVRMLNDDSLPVNHAERVAELQRQMREADSKAEYQARGRERRRKQNTTRVEARRADFCFENVVVNRTSVSRMTPGIGVRYGVPHQDRKKGEVKIPRKVE